MDLIERNLPISDYGWEFKEIINQRILFTEMQTNKEVSVFVSKSILKQFIKDWTIKLKPSVLGHTLLRENKWVNLEFKN